VGLTAGAQDVESPVPVVALEALDIASYSDADADWRGIGVSYSFPRMLLPVFHAGCAAVADDVFRFGLRAKAASLALQDAWRALSTRGSTISPPRAATALRARLQRVVDALLFHLHVDCLAAADAALSAALAAARDFGALQRAADTHARSLQADSLLAQPSLHACLYRLLALAERFASLVRTASIRGALASIAEPAPRGDQEALASLSDALDTDVRYLANARASSAAPNALLLNIDFNDFFGV
jgi:hypothetical protein